MIKELIYRFKRPFHLVKTGLLRGLPAEIKYHFPARKLRIICITGTDGKTTSSTLLYHVLKKAGRKVALLTTVAAYIGDQSIGTGFHVTTPDPRQLQAFLARMVSGGYQDLVLEATSHGIYQHRLWGIHPFLVGVTNISFEHLDYHVTYDAYLAAKAILIKDSQIAVLNADDELSYNKLRKVLQSSSTQITTYSQADSLPNTVREAIIRRFPQAYNQMNARLVYAMSQKLGIDPASFVKAVAAFPSVVGRMQTVVKKKNIEVVVDFAHTPNAVRAVLTALRQRISAEKLNRLIAVFGCAGLRDWQKRPKMGRIGAELADIVIFTAEDPRTEDVWSIIRQMKQDLRPFHAKVLSICDRGEAINFAVQQLAEPGDIVALLGKGHEQSMCYGKKEYPWSDAKVAQEAITIRGRAQQKQRK